MVETKKIPLVSSEISGLWDSYMSDTLITCVLRYYINRVDDNETKAILQQTLDLSNKHIIELKNLFNQENLTIPEGFTEKDVNVNAPRLFTDVFYLNYLSFMSRVGMFNYTLILNQIARSDIRAYFSKRIDEYLDLYNSSADLRLAKGVFIRAPRIEVVPGIQYIKSQSFMLDWFGDKRPILASEITQIFGLIFGNLVGRAITTGFGQVSKNKVISTYFFEGKDIATDHIRELTSILANEGIPIPSASDSFLTDSTESPFSEKLLLTHSAVLSSSGISSLGIAMAATMRSDLTTKYIKYISAIMKYTKKGADIMIDNRWLEQPPQSINHENLAKI